MSLRKVRNQKIDAGPKRGHGIFRSSNTKTSKTTTKTLTSHQRSDPPNYNTMQNSLSLPASGHRLTDSPNSKNSSHILSSPAIGRRLIDSPNFNNNSHNSILSNRNSSKTPLKNIEKEKKQLIVNNGPRRGVLQGPSVMHNISTIKSNKSSGPMIVPLQIDENGKYHLVPHEGPKRGIYLGPGAVHFNSISSAQNGPKRGIGYMNIMNQLNEYDKRAVEYVNNFRKENNLPPLQYSKLLSEIAMPHTLDMLNKKVPLGHSGFNERTNKVPSYRATGENVGYECGYSDPMKTLFDGWLNSPPHRKNMLGNFNYIGVAFANKGDTWYGTQFFALI